MPQNRFYVEDLSYPELSDSELSHMKVMRLRDGETFELVDGKGHLAIASFHNGALTLHESHHSAPSAPLIIAQGMPHLNKFELILEKGCELGMTEIIFFVGDLSEKDSINEKQLDRCRKILISAMKQSGRLYLPQISVSPLPDILDAHKDKLLLFGDTQKQAPPLLKQDASRPLIFFVGPEKGFSESEEQWLRKNAQGVSLSPNILRTETAPLAALAIISQMRL